MASTLRGRKGARNDGSKSAQLEGRAPRPLYAQHQATSNAGSGRCDDLIRVKGVKSAMCEAADVPMKRTPVTLPNFG